MAALRIGTFNVENLDDRGDDRSPNEPPLSERIPLLQAQINRMDADILLLQEVHGQETEGNPRQLLALDAVLAGTRLSGAAVVSTVTSRNEPYDVRNLVVVSRHPVLEVRQFNNDLIDAPRYRRITAEPVETEAREINVERPIQLVKVAVEGVEINLINLHLKSKRPTNIPGQKVDSFTWKSAGGFAEGFFLSSLKRVSQALETRQLVDQIFSNDPSARIIVAGDFNAEPDEVPVQAIRGAVEDTNNPELAHTELTAIARTIAESNRFSLIFRGKQEMIDHMLVSRSMLSAYRGIEIHNEALHDESIAFANDLKFPDSDHAPVVAEFDLDPN